MGSSRGRINDHLGNAQQIPRLPSWSGGSNGRKRRMLQKHLIYPKGRFYSQKHIQNAPKSLKGSQEQISRADRCECRLPNARTNVVIPYPSPKGEESENYSRYKSGESAIPTSTPNPSRNAPKCPTSAPRYTTATWDGPGRFWRGFYRLRCGNRHKRCPKPAHQCTT